MLINLLIGFADIAWLLNRSTESDCSFLWTIFKMFFILSVGLPFGWKNNICSTSLNTLKDSHTLLLRPMLLLFSSHNLHLALILQIYNRVANQTHCSSNPLTLKKHRSHQNMIRHHIILWMSCILQIHFYSCIILNSCIFCILIK